MPSQFWTRWWQLKYFYFYPKHRGNDPIWLFFFQMGGSTTNYSSECVNDIGKWSQLVNCTEALMAQELDESSEVVGKDQAGEENTWALWALRCREPMDSSPTWETVNYIWIMIILMLKLLRMCWDIFRLLLVSPGTASNITQLTWAHQLARLGLWHGGLCQLWLAARRGAEDPFSWMPQGYAYIMATYRHVFGKMGWLNMDTHIREFLEMFLARSGWSII